MQLATCLTYITLFCISIFPRNAHCGPTIRIQSFGRTVPLGTLYDAHTVSFIPGSSVFRPGFQIPPTAVESKLVTGSKLQVHPLDSTMSKFHFSDDDMVVSRSDILSILCEQLKVEGSWRFLVEEPKGQSICFKTELRRKRKRNIDVQLIRVEGDYPHVHFDWVAMPHTVVHQFSAQELLAPRNLNATHFVVGISYGKSIAAVYEDHSKLRKYGLEAKLATRSRTMGVISERAHEHSHLARLYTDRPLHATSTVDLPEELEQHYLRFGYDNEGDDVPLMYELLPLSAVITFLDVNDTVRSQLVRRWNAEFYIGDPYIDPFRMDRIYREFDRISIAQFRLKEAASYLHEPGVGNLVQLQSRRWNYVESLNTLQMNLERALEMFKNKLRDILAWYRHGKFQHGTFEEALERTLYNFQRDTFSVTNVTRILDTQYPGLPKAICLEQLENALDIL